MNQVCKLILAVFQVILLFDAPNNSFIGEKASLLESSQPIEEHNVEIVVIDNPHGSFIYIITAFAAVGGLLFGM